MKKNTGKLIATAAAGLFLAGTSLIAASPARANEPYCQVKNSCKGKGSCGVKGKHDCSGKNACKGQGWVKLKITQEDCEKVQDATWMDKKEEKKS